MREKWAQVPNWADRKYATVPRRGGYAATGMDRAARARAATGARAVSDARPPSVPVEAASADPSGTVPVFRRATPVDALDRAMAIHLGGSRLDMGALAASLAISRATLYRWVGSREQLLEQVLAQRARVFIDAGRPAAEGRGVARVFDTMRHLLDASKRAEPAKLFLKREPELALRILTSERGAVHRITVDGLTEVAAETLTPRQVRALAPRIDSAVQVGALLTWVPVAIGDEPPSERIFGILEQLLTG